MATTVAGSSGATGQTVTSITVPLPTGWQPWHLCVLAAASGTASGTLSAPAGWTAVDSSPVDVNLAEVGIWWRLLQTGDTAPVVSYATAVKLAAAAVIVGGCSADTPLSVFGTRYTRPVGSPIATVTANGTTAGVAGQLILAVFIERSSPGSGTPSVLTDAPAGMTVREDRHALGGGAVSVLVADEIRATAGATGDRTATYNLSSDSGYGLMVAITPGPHPAVDGEAQHTVRQAPAAGQAARTGPTASVGG